MELFRLSNLELDSKLKTLAQSERELLHEVVLHIHEADRRRLYLELSYPNLFEYLTKSCGFSNASAQRRIDAARLLTPVPEVANKLKSGEVSLSQVSYLQKAIREKNKTERVSAEAKQEIIRSISQKSMAETQKIVAQTLDLEIVAQPKETHQKDESVRLEVTFTKDEWAELLCAREILSNSSASNSWSQTIVHLARKETRRKVTSSTSATSAAEVQVRQRNIPAAVRRKIFNRDKVCQYKDKTSGKICGGRWYLEIDHIQPIWAGGTDEESNLRLLCRNHNQLIYRKQANIKPTDQPASPHPE
jgi:hypothetical protein